MIPYPIPRCSVRHLVVAAAVCLPVSVQAGEIQTEPGWQATFAIDDCTLKTTGRNPYFILEPGYQLVLESEDTKLQVTVLDETEVVDGVTTRVVEEREWEEGELYEISRNFFVLCEETKDVFYYGEDVDFYKGKKVVGHDGAWRAGEDGNKPGLMMPGAPRVGMKYYQELAPGIAMDRAEIVSLNETCTTPVGTFENCMKVKEQSASGFASKVLGWDDEYKYHVPGIGLVQDEDLVLTNYTDGGAGQ